ncbi:hypothetical protein [Coleofasciculus sp.]
MQRLYNSAFVLIDVSTAIKGKRKPGYGLICGNCFYGIHHYF